MGDVVNSSLINGPSNGSYQFTTDSLMPSRVPILADGTILGNSTYDTEGTFPWQIKMRASDDVTIVAIYNLTHVVTLT